ncbi:MAG TPA: LuxR C-terminal-related transcriptional regulator [Chthonomonadaceae bacterium]|nr:LuxR C-terminal-related transcriptional regulator [Chthonomonadaceae bacterium]
MSILNPQSHMDYAETIKLTRREIEILTLINEGFASSDIADRLFVSKRTVDFHVSNILEKLQVNNRIRACRRAMQLGLISAF